MQKVVRLLTLFCCFGSTGVWTQVLTF
jgi:hypothetical protein